MSFKCWRVIEKPKMPISGYIWVGMKQCMPLSSLFFYLICSLKRQINIKEKQMLAICIHSFQTLSNMRPLPRLFKVHLYCSYFMISYLTIIQKKNLNICKNPWMTKIWGLFQKPADLFKEFNKIGTGTFIILTLHNITTDLLILIFKLFLLFFKCNKPERLPGNLPVVITIILNLKTPHYCHWSSDVVNVWLQCVPNLN